MLIRFILSNLFSFSEQKEFVMIPDAKFSKLGNHLYAFDGFDLLKMASIYGANAAGKSNFIKSLALLQELVIEEKLPIRNTHYRFHQDTTQLLAVEFMEGNQAFYYGLQFNNKQILTEELYRSGLGKIEDLLIFERTTNLEGKTILTFSSDFEQKVESQTLKDVLDGFTKPNETVFKLIATKASKYLPITQQAFYWFDNSLQIIMPEARPSALTQKIDTDSNFKTYAENIMSAFQIGIESLRVEKKNVSELDLNEENLESLLKKVDESTQKMIGYRSKKGEILFVKENDDIFIKQIKLKHIGQDEISADFDLEDESDGTIRLLDFIPAFKDLITKNKVFIIDEIERSIHPLLIKELVKKFSESQTKGQLIFTTHESNLLDLSILREDEIWFTEKNKKASTDLYSLSSFKPHQIPDLEKGYLNGRYGAVPFLANIQDLNWNDYVSE